jgi:hypothetical protein
LRLELVKEPDRFHGIANAVSERDKAILHENRRFAPGWMQPLFDRILASALEFKANHG